MGILAILAGLTVWHGLARCLCWLVTGGWGMNNVVDVVCHHLVVVLALIALAAAAYLIALACLAIGPINWPAVWHWLLWME